MASQALVDASKAAMAKDYAGALALLEGTIEEPERSSAVAQNILGVCLWKVGRLDEASACLGALAPQSQADDAVDACLDCRLDAGKGLLLPHLRPKRRRRRDNEIARAHSKLRGLGPLVHESHLDAAPRLLTQL